MASFRHRTMDCRQSFDCCGDGSTRRWAGQGQPMMTVRTAMVSLLPAAICAQRPGDAIPGCIATLPRPRHAAIWPELGNGSFQTHGGRNDAAERSGDATPRRMTQRTCVPALTDQGAKAAQRLPKPLLRGKCSAWASLPAVSGRREEIRACKASAARAGRSPAERAFSLCHSGRCNWKVR